MTINISYQQTLSYFKSSSTKGGQHPVLHIIWESCGHNAPIIKNANIMLFPLIQNLSGVKKKVTSCGKRAEGNLPFAPQDSTSTILKTDDSSVKKKCFLKKDRVTGFLCSFLTDYTCCFIQIKTSRILYSDGYFETLRFPLRVT